jgi:hypothetical protein
MAVSTEPVLRQAQDEEIWGCIIADGVKKTPHAELVEARRLLIQPIVGVELHEQSRSFDKLKMRRFGAASASTS